MFLSQSLFSGHCCVSKRYAACASGTSAVVDWQAKTTEQNRRRLDKLFAVCLVVVEYLYVLLS